MRISITRDYYFLRFLFQRSDPNLKRISARMAWFFIMVVGFIVLCYYKAQMNAAFNVYVEKIPIESWDDVLLSDYQVLVWTGTSAEFVFKLAPEGTDSDSFDQFLYYSAY